jgi:hypothetical protein
MKLINSITKDTLVTLYYSVENEKLEVMRLLLSHGADPNKFEIGSQSPIQFGIENNKIEKVELLARTGGIESLLALDPTGMTPLELLASSEGSNVRESRDYFDIIFKAALYGQMEKFEINEAELKRKSRNSSSRDVTIQLSLPEAKLVVASVNQLLLFLFSRSHVTSLIMKKPEMKLSSDELSPEPEAIIEEMIKLAEPEVNEEKKFAAGLISDRNLFSEIFPESRDSLLIQYWKEFASELGQGQEYSDFIDEQFDWFQEFIDLHRTGSNFNPTAISS